MNCAKLYKKIAKFLVVLTLLPCLLIAGCFGKDDKAGDSNNEQSKEGEQQAVTLASPASQEQAVKVEGEASFQTTGDAVKKPANSHNDSVHNQKVTDEATAKNSAIASTDVKSEASSASENHAITKSASDNNEELTVSSSDSSENKNAAKEVSNGDYSTSTASSENSESDSSSDKAENAEEIRSTTPSNN